MSHPIPLTEELHLTFQDCVRPEHFTDHEHCDECLEHDQTMRKATRVSLGAKAMGTAGWGPLSFLTAEGFAYYMPRFLELALEGDTNRFGEPFLSVLIDHLVPSEDYDRFSEYSCEQNAIVLRTLKFILSHQDSVIQEYMLRQEFDDAIQYWERRVQRIA